MPTVVRFGCSGSTGPDYGDFGATSATAQIELRQPAGFRHTRAGRRNYWVVVGKRIRSSWRWVSVVAVVCGAVVAAGASYGATSSASRSSGASSRLGDARPAYLTPPAEITGQPILSRPETAKAGTLVKSFWIGDRVFVNDKVGFALGNIGNAQYAAKTTDGGPVWRTFGPAMDTGAAQAPATVSQIGVANARTIYFFGGGQVVDATGDGGRHWWRGFTDGLSVAVVSGVGQSLLWFIQVPVDSSDAKAVTWVYTSNDGGEFWRYTTALGG